MRRNSELRFEMFKTEQEVHQYLAQMTIDHNVLAPTLEDAFALAEALINIIHHDNLAALEDYDQRSFANYLWQNPAFYKVLMHVQNLAAVGFLPSEVSKQTTRVLLIWILKSRCDEEMQLVFANASQNQFIDNYLFSCNLSL